jgi:hypothetical protein
VRQEEQQTRCQKWVYGVIGKKIGEGKKLSFDNPKILRALIFYSDIAEVPSAISPLSLLSSENVSRQS